MWALVYISHEDEERISRILEMNILNKIMECVNSDYEKLKIPALRTIGNLINGPDDETIDIMIDHGIIETLANSLQYKTMHVRKEAAWIISNILAGKKTHVEQVFEYKDGEIFKTLFVLIKIDDKKVNLI